MNENFEKNSNLNDAELASASGGRYNIPLDHAHQLAKELCEPCTCADHSRLRCSMEHRSYMIDYIMEHGWNFSYMQCPFYNR